MGRSPRVYEVTREHETLIVAAVAIFGLLVAFPGVMVLTGSLTSGLLPVPVAHGARFVAIGEAILGLGLIARSDVARRVFVIAACAGMVYFGVEVVREHAADRRRPPRSHLRRRASSPANRAAPPQPCAAPKKAAPP